MLCKCIQKGDVIVFNERRTLMNKLVSWRLRSPYTHTAIMITDTTMVEATSTDGVCISQLTDDRTYEVVRLNEIYDYDKQKLVDYLLSKIGTRYDFISAIFIGIFNFIRNILKGNGYDTESSVICTELVVRAFRHCGVDIFHDKDSELIIPEDFLNTNDFIKIH